MKKHMGYLLKGAAGAAIAAALILIQGAVQAEAAQEVSFSAGSGAYNTAFSLTLSAGAGDTIYYTRDGSDPADPANTARIAYTSPVAVTDRTGDANVLSAMDPVLFDSANVGWDSSKKQFYSKVSAPANDAVDKATVIRAVSQDSEGNYSAVTTNTYFVGAMTDHITGIRESCEASGIDLAVMSITVNPDDFFDAEKGIYVHGKLFDQALEEYLRTGSINGYNAVDVARGLNANYKQRGKQWERPAHIDYFESNGEQTVCQLQQDCGIRIQGNYSRSDLQKGMRLVANASYGKKNFTYAFFGDQAKNDNGTTLAKYKKLVLRNGGNSCFTTKCSDAYWQSLIRDLDCETQSSRACVVYLNGEYWGLYILQEDYNDSYFEQKHNVVKENVVVYKGDAETYALGYKLDEGTLPAGVTDETYYLQELLEFYQTHSDLKKKKDYDAFAQLVDVESVRDYFAVNVWINNKWDWPGKNWSIWKVTAQDSANPYADGRWRLCFYDLDFGGVSGASDANTNTIKDDNYKDKGLLDMNTSNPVVLMYAYLMTNKGFRDDFAQKLQALSEENFNADTAVAACEVYQNTYAPLFDQFFARYGVGNKNDALNGGYGSFACIKGFIKKRAKAVTTMLKWVDQQFPQEEEDPGEEDPGGENPGGENPGSGNNPGGNNGNTGQGTSTGSGQNNSSNVSTQSGGETKTDGTPESVQKKKAALKVTAKKGKKKIKISTTKKAKIRIVVKKKIIIKGKKRVKKITIPVKQNKKGKYTLRLSRKLKKGDTITVQVQKSGYQSVKKKVKIS